MLSTYDDVEAMVSARNAAIREWTRFFDGLEAAHVASRSAQAILAQATGGFGFMRGHGEDDDLRQFSRAVSVPPRLRMIATAAQLVDARMWSAVFDRSGLEYLMDAQAKAEWRAQLEFQSPVVDGELDASDLEQLGGVPGRLPPFTVENVRASIEHWKCDAVDIFSRGLSNAFSALDSRFRSHDGFKIGARVILTSLYREYGSDNYKIMDTFVDLERAFMVLDGVPRPEIEHWRDVTDEDLAAMPEKLRACYHKTRRGWAFGLSSVLRDRSSSPHKSEHESPYFLVRVFKNGNAHVWFRRPDLVAAVNALLAEYYGAGLGYGRETYDEGGNVVEPADSAIMALARARPQAKNLGFYPTPEKLAERVVEEADIRPGMTVLEPSAGLGALVRPAIRRGCKVTAVEIDPDRAGALMCLVGTVRVADFLGHGLALPLFDRIVMNPPFDRGRDCDHVRRALQFLEPDGVLVSIMSASARYGSGPRHAALRKAIGDRPVEWIDLPPGSFKEAGTNVNTGLLVVGKKVWRDTWNG